MGETRTRRGTKLPQYRTWKIYPEYTSEHQEDGYHLIEKVQGQERSIAVFARFEDIATVLLALGRQTRFDALEAKLAHLADIMGEPTSHWEATQGALNTR